MQHYIRRSRLHFLAALGVGVIVFGLFTPGAATAHGLDPDRVVIRLAGDTVYVTATPSIATFSGCDRDGDGRWEDDELAECREMLFGQMEASLLVVDHQGQRGERVFSDVQVPHGHGGETAPAHLRFVLRYRWSTPPAWLTVRYAFGDRHALTAVATRMSAERRLADQRPVSPTQAVVLDDPATEYRLLEERKTRQ